MGTRLIPKGCLVAEAVSGSGTGHETSGQWVPNNVFVYCKDDADSMGSPDQMTPPYPVRRAVLRNRDTYCTITKEARPSLPSATRGWQHGVSGGPRRRQRTPHHRRQKARERAALDPLPRPTSSPLPPLESGLLRAFLAPTCFWLHFAGRTPTCKMSGWTACLALYGWRVLTAQAAILVAKTPLGGRVSSLGLAEIPRRSRRWHCVSNHLDCRCLKRGGPQERG